MFGAAGRKSWEGVEKVVEPVSEKFGSLFRQASTETANKPTDSSTNDNHTKQDSKQNKKFTKHSEEVKQPQNANNAKNGEGSFKQVHSSTPDNLDMKSITQNQERPKFQGNNLVKEPVNSTVDAVKASQKIEKMQGSSVGKRDINSCIKQQKPYWMEGNKKG